jgi:hypothetical protein
MHTLNLVYFSLALGFLLLLVIIWQGIRLYRLEAVRREFFSSGLKKDLEQILIDQNRSLSQIKQELKLLDKNLENLVNENRNNYQKVGFVRYNPFDDSGGNISFALALLNDHDDGFVISSLHGREGTRVYAKAIKNTLSESKLTEEELKAIKIAK